METTSTRPRRTLAVTAVGAVAIASSLAFAGPVQADAVGSHDGCKITVLDPVLRDHSAVGDPRYNYRFSAKCYGDRTVVFEHEAYQARGTGYRLRGERTGQWNFSQNEKKQSTKNKTYWYTLKDYNTSDRELVYHRVRVKVTSNRVDGAWSQWYATAPVSVRG